MRFGLLGSLLLIDEAGAPVPIGGARLRVLLAALLLQANTPVSAESLAERVWDGAPPAGAVRTLRSHLGRLRRALGGEAERVVARDPGYLIRVQPGELDVLAFEERCRQARSALARGAWADASDVADSALALWRGEPLLDVASQVLRDEFAPRFAQLRLQALEDRAEAELRLGRYERLVPQLRELTAANPLRERFQVQLMTALAGAGRRAEALAAYRDARGVLVDELGVEPGPELRAVHERILAGGDARPATEPPAEPEPSPRAVRTVPRQLPAAPGHFTGRQGELELLADLANPADAAAPHGGTVVITAIDGMAGIGKTALAVHAAHRLSDRFPDGQLFVDLHGYTKGAQPRAAGDVLEAFLRSLGVAARQIPEDVEQRAALYRQQLADTRILIVLDNAVSEAQVRPLLPGCPGCLVLVTSRRRLKGLDDAYPISLDVLAPPDALTLLRAVIGAGRVAAEDRLLDEIARLCGRLPLALRIAGALLRHRPSWRLQRLVELLGQARTLSDGERDLAGVFDLSYTGLDEQHRLLFRRLGLVPGPDADAFAAAALLAGDPRDCAEMLDDLADHNLLIEHAPGRYRMHDLLRAHARALANQDAAEDNEAALDRLLHYYAHTARSASVPIGYRQRTASGDNAPTHVPALSDPDAAQTWLHTERDNLLAAHTHAQDLGLPAHALALADGLAEILRQDGHVTQALNMHRAAVDTAQRHGWAAAHAAALTNLAPAQRLTGDFPGAADTASRAVRICREIGDRSGEASALIELEVNWQQTGNLAGATDALTRVLEIFREIGYRDGEARALICLGDRLRQVGDLPGAADALTRALRIFQETGHREGEGGALNDLGITLRVSGDFARSADALARALEIFRALGNRIGEAIVLNNQGMLWSLTGDLSSAADAQLAALEIFRANGNRVGEAYALAELGSVRRMTGDLPEAAGSLTEAMEIFRSSGNRDGEAWVLNHYAASVAAAGDVPRARALYLRAQAMNGELNKPGGEATALEGLGECHLFAGDREPAIADLRQALKIYHSLGMDPDAERVRTRLANLAMT